MLTYVLAVLAAGANATSSVLRRKANRGAPRRENMSLRLIWSLAHEPVWFGGILAVTVGFLLQAASLSRGQLSVVEPILVLELPATLILASRVFETRMNRREWGPAALMTAGLAGMLYFLSPSAGRPQGVRWYARVIGAGINLSVVGALVMWGRRGPADRDPGLYPRPDLLLADRTVVGRISQVLPGRHRTPLRDSCRTTRPRHCPGRRPLKTPSRRYRSATSGCATWPLRIGGDVVADGVVADGVLAAGGIGGSGEPSPPPPGRAVPSSGSAGLTSARPAWSSDMMSSRPAGSDGSGQAAGRSRPLTRRTGPAVPPATASRTPPSATAPGATR